MKIRLETTLALLRKADAYAARDASYITAYADAREKKNQNH